MVEDAKLHQFIGQMLSDLGGAASVAGGACPAIAKARRLVDDHRADGWRQTGGESEPGRYYAGSTMGCVPTSLSQEVGTALGAQAGEKRLREVITAGGFRNVRRAAETPFNMILEARP